MSSATPPTEYFPGINFNPSFYNLGQSAVTLDYLNSNFLRSTGYAISRAQFTLFNGSVDINENLDVSGNINASAYLVNNIPVSFSQWTTSNNDIYYNTGNVGIGKTNPSANYILDVSGNINADKIFRSGTELTQYTDTNVRTVLSTSAGTNMTWNTGTNKFDVAAPYTDTNTRTVLSTSAGTNITWNTGTNKFDVSVPPSYTDTNTRTVLSTSAGTNMTWNTGTNQFDVAAPYTDANVRTVLSNSAGTNMTWNTGTNRFDVAAPYTDTNVRTVLSTSAGTNMTWNTGTNKFDVNVISSQWTTTGTEIYYSTGKVGIGLTNPSSSGATLQVTGTVSLSSSANTSLFWSGFTNTLIGRANTAGTYSSSAGVGDLVLSSNNKIIIKSGASTNPIAMCVDTSNNVGIGKTNPSQNLDVSGNILALRLGVGTTSILSNYSLDVSGNIITTGNIALVNGSTSIFWTGTNSNLGRAGFGGEYSTSAAINDIVLRSGNKLILQSGVGAAGLIIDVSNNIGINTVIPSASLDIVKTHASGTNIDQFKMRYDTSWGLIFQQSFTGTGNIQYNVLNRYNNVNYNSLTFKAANVGIFNTSPIGPLTIGNGSIANQDGFMVLEKCTTVGTTRQFRIGLNSAFDLAIGDYGNNNVAGTWTEQFKIAYSAPANSLTIGSTGIVSVNNLRLKNDSWSVSSADGKDRVYCFTNGGTIIQGHGTIPLSYKIGNGATVAEFSDTGNFGIGKTPSYKLDVNGEINGTNLRINGVDIYQIIKNQHLFSLYRVSITYYAFGFGSNYWEGVWDFETNLKFNEYSRPDLNVRWNISGSINNGNGNDSNKYFFMNFFYNKLGNSIQYHATHSYGTWTFQNYWGSQGNNFLRIICRLDAAADYLNINIS